MQVGKRMMIGGGPKLPYDAEVEWLQCVGLGTYIDTGIYPNATTDCEIGVIFAGANNKYPTPIGMVDGTTRYLIRYGSYTAFFQLSAGNGVAFEGKTANGPSSVNVGFERIFKIASGKSYVDGVWTSDLYGSVRNLDDFAYTLWIGNQNFQNTINSNADATNMRITFCKIIKGGVLVRDFIPVCFTNEQGVSEGAMYDRANPTVGMNPDGSPRTDGLYRNRGTGAFVIGPEIVPVEYIGSDGAQWIDTGVVPLSPDTLRLDVGVRYSDTSSRSIMGRQGGFYFGPCNGRLQPGLGGTGTVDVALNANEWYDCSFTYNVPPNWEVAGSVDYRVGNTSGRVDMSNPNANFFLNSPADGSVWICAANNSTSLRGENSISYFRILRNGVAIRDFRPVRVGNVGAMRDILGSDGMNTDGTARRDGLYFNRGTGAFIIGPDKTANMNGGGHKCLRYSPSLFLRFSRRSAWKEAA